MKERQTKKGALIEGKAKASFESGKSYEKFRQAIKGFKLRMY